MCVRATDTTHPEVVTFTHFIKPYHCVRIYTIHVYLLWQLPCQSCCSLIIHGTTSLLVVMCVRWCCCARVAFTCVHNSCYVI